MTTKNLTIEAKIEVAASAPAMIAALTTEAGFRGWFTDGAACDGTHAAFPFKRTDGMRLVMFRIEHQDARGIAMTCTAVRDNPDWLGTKLALSFGGNRVRVVHSGYPEQNECYEQCVGAWPYFLASLKSYLETGRGTPNVN